MNATLASSFLLALLLAVAPRADRDEFVERLYEQGSAAEKAGNVDAARAAYARALERDAKHLPTLARRSALEKAAGRHDEALDDAGRFLAIWRYLKERPQGLMATQRELAAYALEADPLRKRNDALRRDYVGRLLVLANEQMDHLAWHSARAMLVEAQTTDPEHPELAAGLARIKKEGGNELAVEDETGGVDPLAGVTAEWIAANDPLHTDWDKAWELETPHYKIRTNSGYRVLKTVATAMEQVHGFYREFHQYKTKGESIPVANVLIFKSAAEYKTLGNQPVEWAAGHWDGTNVVTYDARNGGEGGLAGMLDTLFHEASHQFTTLAGGGAVPAWLNEGMASFFEGTKLLSNGKLAWNLPVPGRLYPLVEDLRGPKPNGIAKVMTGEVDDYRVNYPYGWGIVYYLYNAEDDDGRLLYRSGMREYFQEYHSEDHVARFTEFFVTRPKLPGVATLADFEKRWKDWIFGLEAEDKGLADAARRDEERADRQMKQGNVPRAIELYERSLRREPDHPETTWKLAAALEAAKQGDRAAGTLRRWMSITAARPGEPDPEAARRADALARIAKLDTSAKRLAEMRTRFHADALQLAKDYRAKGFPRLALRTLRGPATAQPPSAEARALYFAIQDESGVSLETWRLLFDERTLKGFYGGGESDFRVAEGVIEATITADEDVQKGPSTGASPTERPKKADTFAFRRLFVDVEPAGDWSLQADVEVAKGGTLGGLCFGKKGDGLFHGVALLPQGYCDLASFGTDGKTLLRTNAKVGEGWHTLRIEVAGTRLVVQLDGAQVLEWLFDSRAALQGDFGLLAGVGKSRFREIRLLEFDASLPRRTEIGRRRVVQPDEADKPLLRSPGGQPSYLNQAPPLLTVQGWIGTPPAGGDLEKLRGWPCLLAFWSTYQEKAVPIVPGLEKLRAAHADLDIPILVLTNEKREVVEGWLKDHPMPFPVGYDNSNALFQAYAIEKVQLPHAKLLGLDGRVVWEGNPDYKEEFGSYLDEPLADLVKRARLPELKVAAATLEKARAAEARGEYAAAAQDYRAIATIDAAHPTVAAAKKALEALEARGAAEIARGDALEKDGRILQALKVAENVVTAYAGLDAAGIARTAVEKRKASKSYKKMRPLENKLVAAEKSLESGKLDDARTSLGSLQASLAAGGDPKPDPWLVERVQELARFADGAKDGKDVIRRYRERFPELGPSH
ncbi:MAG: redoxin domain-containing protein [Planctomycetota bacterium]|nr:redoxin domain-containing protein [Planctomycetota bacterium]